MQSKHDLNVSRGSNLAIFQDLLSQWAISLYKQTHLAEKYKNKSQGARNTCNNEDTECGESRSLFLYLFDTK